MVLRGMRLAWIGVGLALCLGVCAEAWALDITSNVSITGENGFVIDGSSSDDPLADGGAYSSLTIDGATVRTDGDVTLSGGSLILGDDSGNGSLVLWDPPASDGRPDVDGGNYAATFTMSNGQLKVGNDTYGGYMEVARFVVSGGTVTIGGGGMAGSNSNWADESSFITSGWDVETPVVQNTGNAAVSLTDGIINMLSKSRIQTAWGGSISNLFHIGGDVTINLNGGTTLAEAAVLKAADPYNRRDPSHAEAIKGSTMLIDGTAKINVSGANKHGVILSRETVMNGGRITASDGGRLTVAGSADESDKVGTPNRVTVTSLSDGLANTSRLLNWGKFTINDGGSIVTTTGGIIDFTNGGNYSSTANGVTRAFELHASGGSLTGGLIIVPTAASASGTYSQNLTVQGGKFTVDNFTLASGGVVNIDASGNLNITGSINTSGISAPTGNLKVNAGGTLTAKLASVMGSVNPAVNGMVTAGSTAAAGLKNALAVDAAGRVYLDAESAGNKIAQTEMDRIAAALGIDSARLRFLNLSVAGQDSATGTATGGDALVTGALTNTGGRSSAVITSSVPGALVNNVTFDNSIEVGSLDIASGGNVSFAQDLAVDFDADAQLFGFDGNFITVNGQGAAPDVNASNNLVLGGPSTGYGSVYGGALGDVTVGGDLSIDNAWVDADSITMDNGGQITVGSNDMKGTLEVGQLNLNNGLLFLDPVWPQGVTNPNPGTATAVAIGGTPGLTPDPVNGKIIIGRNSHLTYGSTDSEFFADILRQTGMWGPTNGITAALAVRKGLVLGVSGTDSIVVDGNIVSWDNAGVPTPAQSVTPTTPITLSTYDNRAVFTTGSLLAIDAQALNGTAAISGDNVNSVLDVQTGAVLGIYNAKANSTVTVFSGFTPANSVSAANWGVLRDSFMVNVIPSVLTGSVNVIAENAHTVYRGINGSTANMLNALYGEGLNDTNSLYADRAFFSRATNIVHNGTNLTHHIATIEGVTGISAVGGSQVQAYNITRMATDAVRERFQFATGFSSAYAAAGVASDSAFAAFKTGTIARTPSRSGLAIWATPTYRHTSVDGMRAGSFDADFDSDMGGVSLGVDFTAGDNVRFGLAGNIGWGDIDSESGAYASTNNDFDYLGANAYVGFSMNNLAFVLDGGFMATDNKLTQANPLGTGTIRADADVHAWNIGVNAEYLFDVGSGFEIAPHAGVRYEALNTRGHNVHDAAGTILNVHSDTQHLLTIPVGVRAGKTFRSGRWGITPYADLGVLIAAGDRDYEAKYSLPTVGGSYGHSAEVVDAVSFDGSVGLRVTNGRFFGGAGYNLLTSADATSHALSANLGITF